MIHSNCRAFAACLAWLTRIGDATRTVGPAGGLKLEKPCRLCRRHRRGATAVEFAVVAPVLILFILGIIEFGRAIMVQQALTNASREGARQAVLDGSTTANVTAVVTNYLSGGSIHGATVAVSPNPPSSAGFGQTVSVTVSVPFNQVSWLPTPMFVGGRTIRATSAMRRETAN